MSIFEWTPIYETGVPAIDDQHRRLMTFVNEMFDALVQGHGEQVVDRILDDLIVYTKQHFEFEEKLLERGGDDDIDAHIAKHRTLLSAVEGLQQRRAAGDIEVDEDTLELLRDWLVSHIRDDDAERAPAVMRGAGH
ncbi:MAG: hemerythrin family protein [Myxococcales bacterium]|nr:hemerythrin family protein [Myxococcales bacterium]